MESYEHNYHNQDPVLENNVDGSSHVVLTNQDSTENQLRRRPHTGIQTAQKLQTHSSPAHPKSPKRIPQWLWAVIAKSLGIKTFATEKPYLSSVLHLLTLASAILMLVTQTLFNGYDIASEMSKTDVLDGTALIIIILLFSGLGIYAHRLAYRLFIHPKFLDMMRLHAKTIFKLNAAAVVFVILMAFVLVINISTANFMYLELSPLGPNGTSPNTSYYQPAQNSTAEMNPCQKVNIPLTICHTYFLSQTVFSFFFLLWNGIVAVILVSVARTHTVNIRRFICQLECDAFLLDRTFRKMFYADNSFESKDSLKDYLWMDSDHLADIMRNHDRSNEIDPDVSGSSDGQSDLQVRRPTQDSKTLKIREQIDDDEPTFYNDATKIELQINASPSASRTNEGTDSRATTTKTGSRKKLFQRTMGTSVFGRFHRLSETLDGKYELDDTLEEESSIEPHVMNEEEIMHKYWKIATSARLTSQAFQRWMAIMTVSIMFWSVLLIVKWLTKTPTISGVLSFIFPLLMLPLLASAYAEVNYEGLRVLQSIMPKEDRTAMFRYLYGLPIQLTAYGHPITYKTIGTVLVAILAAFVSKILLQEMNKVIT